MNKTVLNQSFEYPTGPVNIETNYIESLPGAESGWHTHDRPLLVTILHGTLAIYYCYEDTENSIELDECAETGDKIGTVRYFEAGDSFVEAINVRHNGINEGLIPVKTHIVALNPDQVWDEIYLQPTQRDLVQELTWDAIKLYDEDKAFAINQINYDPRFHKDDLYVFVVNEQGFRVAHGGNPGLVGLQSSNYPDNPVRDIVINGATEDGSWVEYQRALPDSHIVHTKHSFLVKHDGLIFGAGYYEEDILATQLRAMVYHEFAWS